MPATIEYEPYWEIECDCWTGKHIDEDCPIIDNCFARHWTGETWDELPDPADTTPEATEFETTVCADCWEECLAEGSIAPEMGEN